MTICTRALNCDIEAWVYTDKFYDERNFWLNSGWKLRKTYAWTSSGNFPRFSSSFAAGGINTSAQPSAANQSINQWYAFTGTEICKWLPESSRKLRKKTGNCQKIQLSNYTSTRWDVNWAETGEDLLTMTGSNGNFHKFSFRQDFSLECSA